LLAKPRGQRHHRLKTHYLKALVKYVEQGAVLKTHDDMPDSLREQLYTEEDWRNEKRNKLPDNSAMCPPININVLPARSSQQLVPKPANDALPAKTGCAKSIIVYGLLDVAVDEYTK
jgi:hypothetical protein